MAWLYIERDSRKDQAVVLIFIGATGGLLLWAVVRRWVEGWWAVSLFSFFCSILLLSFTFQVVEDEERVYVSNATMLIWMLEDNREPKPAEERTDRLLRVLLIGDHGGDMFGVKNIKMDIKCQRRQGKASLSPPGPFSHAF